MFFKKRKSKNDKPDKRELKKRAFTLVEIIIVVFIILTLSVIVIFNIEWGGYQITLNQAAARLTQDIKQLQGFAQSYEQVNGVVPEGGYGVYFNVGEKHSYILFGDVNSNGIFDGVDSDDIIIKEIDLEKGIVFEGYSSGELRGNNLNIVFKSPDPSISIKTITGEEFSEASIFLRSERTNDTASIYINQLGMVEIHDQEEGS